MTAAAAEAEPHPLEVPLPVEVAPQFSNLMPSGPRIEIPPDLPNKDVLIELVDDKGCGYWFIDHSVFKTTITALVLINSIQMGFEVDHPELKHVWKVFDHVFAGAFFLEMVAKVVVMHLDYFRDRWNWLDGIIAILGFIDTWFMLIVGGDNVGLSQFSILRTLRLLRLARFLKMVRHCDKLVVVMKSIMDAMETAFWVACILVLCIYVCAIFCVEYIGRDDGTYPAYATDTPTIDDSETMGNFNPYIVFGDMPTAMLSLFSIAIMAEWAEIVRPVWLKQPPLVLFFLGFVGIVVFGVMNVIIGMIVDTVMQNARALEVELEHTKTEEKAGVIEQLEEIVRDMGKKTSQNEIDPEQLHCLLMSEDPRIKGLMEKVQLPYGCTSKELLALLDTSGNGSIEHTEFLQSFYRLIYSGGFQQTCLIQIGVNKLTRAMGTFERAFQHIDDQLMEHSSQLSAFHTENKENRCRQARIGDGDRNVEQKTDTTDMERKMDKLTGMVASFITEFREIRKESSEGPRLNVSQEVTKADTTDRERKMDDLAATVGSLTEGPCLNISQEVTKAIHYKLQEELTQCFEKVLGLGYEAACADKAAFVGKWHVLEDKTVARLALTSPSQSCPTSSGQLLQRRPPEDAAESPAPPPPPSYPPPGLSNGEDGRSPHESLRTPQGREGDSEGEELVRKYQQR